MVRSIAGHGWRMTSSPPVLSGSELPLRSTMSAATPGSGRVAEPGLVAMAPGKGEIMIMPVSVCHQVSTMGQRPLPMVLWYHIHASGLIGSPTVPSRRRLDRSRPLGHCSPHLTKARIAVGAV
jgi:hypothetical protein